MKAYWLAAYIEDHHQRNHLHNLQTFVKHLDQRTFSSELVNLSHFKLKELLLIKALVHRLLSENMAELGQFIHFDCFLLAMLALMLPKVAYLQLFTKLHLQLISNLLASMVLG